jgi:hypothetical protein
LGVFVWRLSGGACCRKGITGVPEFSKRILAAAANEIQAMLSTCNNVAVIVEARAWRQIGGEVVKVTQVFVATHSIRERLPPSRGHAPAWKPLELWVPPTSRVLWRFRHTGHFARHCKDLEEWCSAVQDSRFTECHKTGQFGLPTSVETDCHRRSPSDNKGTVC